MQDLLEKLALSNFFREKYNRRSVNAKKVTDSYEGTEQFLLQVGKAYILEAALQFWGMEKLDDCPTKNEPPPGISHQRNEKKAEYFHKVIGNFVDEYALPDGEKEDKSGVQANGNDDQTTKPDRVRAYGLNVIELVVFLMQLIDTCKEGDGERSVINKKRLLMYFKSSSSSFKNYSVEMFTWIAQIKALVSEEMAHRLIWGRFVNWNGGAGKNIACDMAQEICNRVSKDIVKGMGPNKTEKSMMRASKAAAGVHQIIQRMNEVTNVKPTSNAHTHKDSKEEEGMMLKDLRKLEPFKTQPGRFHQKFPEIEVSPTSTVDMEKLFKWLEMHKLQIGMGQTKATVT